MMDTTHGKLENNILNAIWHLEETYEKTIVDVSDVQKSINKEEQFWAYTTVKTVLDRLAEKGVIKRIKDGRKYFYSSIFSREELGQKAIRKIAMQYFKNDLDQLHIALQKINEKEPALV